MKTEPQDVATLDRRTLIGALLFAYGMAGIAGNFIAGPLAARHPRGMLHRRKNESAHVTCN